MATVEGLLQRGSTYSLLVLIPKDLQASYGGKKRVVKALGTSDKAEAVRKGLLLKAKWLEEFEAKRKALNPEALKVITPELAQALADSARKRVLKADNIRRDGNDHALNALSHIADSRLPFIRDASGTIKLPQRDPLEGLSTNQMLSLEILNRIQSEESGQHLARRNLLAVFSLLQEDAKALGFSVSRETEGLKDALQSYLKSYRQACLDVSKMDSGELIDLEPLISTEVHRLHYPASPSIKRDVEACAHDPETSDKLTLRALYEQWLKAAPKTKETAQASNKALTLAEAFLSPAGKPLYVKDITRRQGSDFKAWLQDPERGTSPKTAKDRLMYVNSLLRFAFKELEVIPRNPWEGLSIEVPKKVTRRPWKDEELEQLFAQPLFQSFDIPPRNRSGGGPAAYWIPLLGLYTGARIGELAQLSAIDISTVDGIPVIRITDQGDAQKVKSAASRRIVPIHSELIRLGFLEYVGEIQSKAPQGSLWPLLHQKTISSWFSKYRKSIGLTDRWLDFHSFRHTVRTRLFQSRVPEKTMDAITGHESVGSTGRAVYTHLSTQDLQEAIQSLRYETVVLPKVYRPQT